MEEARVAARHAWVLRVAVGLVFAFFGLLVFGTISDTALRAIVFEIAPPPLPAAVGDRDASVTITVVGSREETIADARVFVLYDIDGRVYRAGGCRTNDKGVCPINALPRGHAWVVADAEGYARGSTSLVLAPGAREARLVLGPEHSFIVNIVDAEGHAVPSAEIEVSQTDGLPRGARVDSNGRAEVGRLGEPPWVVTARAPGYDETTARGVRDGSALKLVLHRLGTILVHVVDEADKPVPAARVRIAGTALWPAREGRTGEHGMVKLAGLFAGSYALRATEGSRASPIELGVMLGSGEDKDITLRLAPGRTVVAHVVDGEAEDANDVAGARVVLAESGVSPFPIEAVTDKRGRAMLGPIAAGPATLSARADGFVGKAIAVPEVLQGELRVVLWASGTLTGRVIDARGFPVASATLEVIGNDFAGGPIDDEPQKSTFRDSEFHAVLGGPRQLLPAGELGVVPGPVPAIPSAGATVALGPPTTTSNAQPWVTSSDGTFRLTPVTPGRVRVLVRHPEYVEAWSDVVTVAPGAAGKVDIVLHAGGSIEGRLLDTQSRPVAGARVVLTAAHGTLERGATTASDGTFAFAAVPREVSIDVYADEDAASPVLRAREIVGDGERRDVVLMLPPSRDPVLVRVKDDRGYPVASAQVSMVSLDPALPLRETAFTDAAGEATLVGARGLSIRAEISAPGHAPTHTSTDEAPAEVLVMLGRAVTVSGTIRSSRGDPVADADVILYTDDGVRHLRTDAQGGFVAADVAPSDARLLVRAPGYATTEKRVTVPQSDRPFSVGAIDLAAEGIVEGEVRDERGDAVVGARVARDHVPVFLAQATATPNVAITDVEGRFRLAGLADGAAVLEAYAPDVGRGHTEVRVSAGRSTTNVRIVLSPEGARGADQPGATVAVTLGETGGGGVHDVVIVVVAEGSEAERAGLLAGDVISSVDGSPVHTLEQAREKLNGPQNADALLDVRRQGNALRLRVPREMVRH